MGKKIKNRADELVFQALKKGIETEQIHLCLVESRINRPTSPIYNPWEVLLPILMPVVLGLILILFVGPLFGLIFMVAAILVTSNLVKKKLEQRLMDRAKTFLLSSFENCNILWDFGGLVLVNAANKKIGCIAPDAGWKEFIIKNFAELVAAKETLQPASDPEPITPPEQSQEEPKDETPKHRRRSRRG